MSDYLPAELLPDILTRLPLKTLLRCTSVSKSWYSLITSPNFITSHLNNNPTTHSNNFLMVGRSAKYSTKMHLSLHWDNDTFDEFAQFDFPLKYSRIVGSCNGLVCLSGGMNYDIMSLWNPSLKKSVILPKPCVLRDNDTFDEFAQFHFPLGYFRIVGSCNGLVCLSGGLNYDIMSLWNPSLKKSVILPKPCVLRDFDGVIQPSIGFGIDPVTNDYKIVRLTSLWSNWVPELLTPPEVELFELSTGSWRNINAGVFPYVASPGDRHAVLNGVVHWIGNSPNKGGIIPNLIVSFDMRNESLGVINAPPSVPLHCDWSILTIFGESLSFFQEDLDLSWCLWVMKEYGVESSWTKQYSVDMRGCLGIPTCIRENGEILLERRYRPSKCRDAGLISYDPKSKLIKYLGIDGRVGSFYTDTYNESLVLIKSLNEVLGRKENSDGAVTCPGTSVLPREDDEVNGKSKKIKLE